MREDGSDSVNEVYALHSLSNEPGIRPFRASNHDIAEKYTNEFDFEFGHGMPTDVFRSIDEPSNQDEQIKAINNVLESSNALLNEEGVSVMMISGFANSAYNPNLEYGEGSVELFEEYAQIIEEEAQEYFEVVTYEPQIADKY